MPLAYGILPASGPRTGTIVFLTGGPGEPAVRYAPEVASELAPRAGDARHRARRPARDRRLGRHALRHLRIPWRVREAARGEAAVPDHRRDRARHRVAARGTRDREGHAARGLLRDAGRGRIRAPLPRPDGGADPRLAGRAGRDRGRRARRDRGDAARPARESARPALRNHRRRRGGRAERRGPARPPRRRARAAGRQPQGPPGDGRNGQYRRAARLQRGAVRLRARADPVGAARGIAVAGARGCRAADPPEQPRPRPRAPGRPARRDRSSVQRFPLPRDDVPGGGAALADGLGARDPPSGRGRVREGARAETVRAVQRGDGPRRRHRDPLLELARDPRARAAARDNA